jgi:putative ABC transport system permease protein
METLMQDLRYALRTMRARPMFTIIAVLTLALGIGANTAIFSVVNGVLLRPLPYAKPAELVRVLGQNAKQGISGGTFSPQDFDDLVAARAGYASLAAYMFIPGQTGMNLTGEGEPLRTEVASVSRDFFTTLGVPARLGRALIPEENVPGADREVVLSDGFWRKRFGADARVIGKTASFDGKPFTIVGVMPAAFQFPSRQVDAWAPISLIDDDAIPHRRGIRWMDVIGRLKPGISPAAAQLATTGVLRRLEKAYPEENEGWNTAEVKPLHAAIVGNVRPALLVLLGAVALVLLIACANLANLLLARATTRSSELAIRTALGADRSRLVRQLLTEYVLLALAGGALGLVIAAYGVRALVALSAGSIPRPDEIRPDLIVMAFTFATSVLTGLVAGLIPALKASRADPQAALKEGGRSGHMGRTRHAARYSLVIAETALAVILLSGAALMIKSFYRLTHADPGFRSDNVLTLSITMPFEKYGFAKMPAYRQEILRSIRELPRVIAVGASKTAPLRGGGEPYAFNIPGRPVGYDKVQPESGAFIVTTGYFKALGIPVLRGRAFTEDDDGKAPVLIINDALARKVFPNEDPVGRIVKMGKFGFTVVGVVGNVRNEGIAMPVTGAMYIPASQAPRGTMNIFVRTSGNPLALAGAVRHAIWSVDSEQPISSIATLQQSVEDTVAQPRFFTFLLGIFGGLAVVLAGLGLYGVISYAVGQRVHEISIRMALGASRLDVLGGVLAQAMTLTLAGLAIGLAGSLALTRLLSSQLYDVSARDPMSLAAVGLFLFAVALVSSYLPARRATSVNPMVALRTE